MPRRPSTFKQLDVQRLIKAVRSEGCNVGRITIDKSGKIEVITTDSQPREQEGEANEWDLV
jgi:hypothetical protein